jgi:hypothetical protein
MGELSTLKNSSLVRSKTSLKPERRNATRWYSLFKILVKYKKLKDILPQIQNFPPPVLSLIPNEMEKAQLMELLEDLRKFESVSQMLQNRSQDRPMLCDVRTLFDNLLEDFGAKYQLKHLKKDSDIIENKDFENGIVKIQEHEELNLTQAEKNAVKIFLKPVAASFTPPANGDAEQPATAYAASVLLKRKRIEQDKESAYRETKHVVSTSNICECLFSRAKLLFSPLRKRMKASTLETLLFLNANQNLWPDASIIQKIIDTPNDDDEEPTEGGSDDDEEF